MKSWKNTCCLFCLTCLLSLKAIAQTPPTPEVDLQRFVEEIFAVQDLDVNYEDLYESLFLLYTNPINLNNTNKETLRSLFVLSEIQINSFFAYIEKNGNLLSLYELQAIPEFDLPTIYKILPFVTLNQFTNNKDNRPLLQKIFEEKNNYLLLRYSTTLEQQRGFIQPDSLNHYEGDRNQLYARFRVSHTNDFSIGFTAEKDAGEVLVWDPSTKRYGTDFYSFHFQLKQRGRLKNLIVGDYQLQFAQGLLLSAGFNIGKGAETVSTTRRSNLGARPYTSVVESGFFRGGAATYTVHKNIDITGFLSGIKQDAIIQEDTISDFTNFISSIQNSGFHRTQSEIEAKKQIDEYTIGSNILYTSSNKTFQAGLTLMQSNFSLPLIRRNASYNLFEFKGTQNQNIGMSYTYNWQNFNFFGEAAWSKSGGIGVVNGIIASITKRLEIAALLRHYNKNFHSLYGAAFGEGGRNINESGVYWGLKFTPIKKLQFSAYYDRFKFPWLRFRVSAPSEGYEYLARATYKPNRKVTIYGQFREESKARNQSEQNLNINRPLPGKKRNYLIHLGYPASKQLDFKTRIQFSSYNYNNVTSRGFVIAQDINMIFSKWKVSGRFAIFDTDNFENRQYIYEKDVLFAFSIPAYSGVGVRQYVVLQYRPAQKLTFWLKYARTRRTDADVIGSGLAEITGNTKSDLRLQIRLNF